MALPSVVGQALKLAVKIVLVCVYGLMGSLATVLMCIRLGPKKFFRRVERPTPPPQATDPVYGTHGMLKLKVNAPTLDCTWQLSF